MDLITNPIVLRGIISFLALVGLTFLGMWLMKRMRQSITSETEWIARSSNESRGFELEAYHGVIQRLKDQEQELRRLREEASARAAATENLSAAVLSNLASGVVLLNIAGLVQQANDAAKAILGYASPFGLHARDLFRGVSAVRQENGAQHGSVIPLLEAVEIARTSAAAPQQLAAFRRMEVDYKTPAGAARVLGLTLSPVRNGAGESLGVACLVSDLTEITQLSRQVRTRDSLAALGEMSAGIAHEFKNSLATISGYAQMLATSPDTGAKDFGGRIARETTMLNRIVMDFLEFARPQELKRTENPLRRMVEECAQQAGVHVACEIPFGQVIVGDATALRQTFSNLLRNSREARREDAETEVRVSAQEQGGGVEVELADNGSGIAAEDVEKVFIPFYTTKPQGTGLGLALVHRIVTQHGGHVRVASGPSGTTFTLWLPNAKQG